MLIAVPVLLSANLVLTFFALKTSESTRAVLLVKSTAQQLNWRSTGESFAWSSVVAFARRILLSK